jgi:hypothetical protein
MRIFQGRRHSYERWRAIAAATTLLVVLAAHAATLDWQPETGDIDRATARALVQSLTEKVESRALRPRDQAEYDAAKSRLLELVTTPSTRLERARVYAAANAMLATLDTDGHTQLWSKQLASSWFGATTPEAARDSATTRIIATPGGPVLVVRPPQTTFTDSELARQYAQALIDGVDRAIADASPCALVVDLGDQKGGNAWPPIYAFAPLFTAANTARFVDREGRRAPIVADGTAYAASLGKLPYNELTRFAGHPFAVVMTPQTASAGEMLAIALRGEPGVRWFGQPSAGATTSNTIEPMPDGATMLLTVARYGFGTEPPLRGKLMPDVPAAAGEVPEATLARAAAWAAQSCRKATP